MINSQPLQHSLQLLSESLHYKDLEGMLKPTIHVDEFASKMGDDDDIIVISFFVRDAQASKDLMMWFEKGYDFILDSDKSPGEIQPGRYLVYIEIRRRKTAGSQVHELLEDLNTLTEFEPKDWVIHHRGKTVPFTRENFDKLIPLTPDDYRKKYGDDSLNEMRIRSGMDSILPYEKTDPLLQTLQHAAGI
jgi:hypothetical protein